MPPRASIHVSLEPKNQTRTGVASLPTLDTYAPHYALLQCLMSPPFFVLLHFFACPCDALSKIFSKMHSSWSYPRCADKYLLNLERKSTRKTDRRLSCSCNNTLRRGKYSTKNSLVLESVSIYSTRKRRCQYSLFWSAGAKHISSQYREYVLDVVIGYC